MLQGGQEYVFCSGNSCFFYSGGRRHTRCSRDWSSDVCSSDLEVALPAFEFSADVSEGVGIFRRHPVLKIRMPVVPLLEKPRRAQTELAEPAFAILAPGHQADRKSVV